MAASRSLVVTGATGKQGGAVISALLSRPSQPFAIYAVTRNTTSPTAQRLAQQPNVRVVQGDFNKAAAIFDQLGGATPWGLFAMTDQMAGEEQETRQGEALVAAAVDAGVRHIVFTATDRGGPGKSDDNPTHVPHFRSKYRVERAIRRHAAESQGALTWTFLRPVAFFENLAPGLFGKGFMAMWRLNGPTRPLQQISTADIGAVAADAFLHAESDEYRDRAVSLAGDALSPDDAARIFREVTGEDIPAAWALVGRLLKLVSADLRHMFDWLREEDFGVDVRAVRRRYPFMRDFRGWLEQESAWKTR